MANILDIRRRIRSVINTRQITRAMKMISAARLRRAQERALSARPYAQMLTNVLRSLVQRTEIYDPETGEARHPLLAQRPVENILLVVVTGDKGLAGAFNTNINKAAMRFIAERPEAHIDLFTVGRKGRDFLRRRFPTAVEGSTHRVQLVGDLMNFATKLQYETIGDLVETAIDRYSKCEIDAVYVIYNEFKSVISQRLVVEQVLPVGEIGASAAVSAQEMSLEERERMAEAAKTAGVSLEAADTSAIDQAAARFATAQVDYIYEQQPDELFNALLPKYVGVQVWRSVLESVASEHAARMTAMDSATSNAGKMIDALTLAMNRARQAKITKEIIEIVSGAAAQ